MHGRVPIVVLDPDPAARAFLSEATTEAGARCRQDVTVFEAEDGADGARLIARQNPAVVVGEVMLDKLSGLALLRQVQRHRAPERRPAFLFVTRMANESDRSWGLRSGAYAYFGKPCEREPLVTALRNCLVALSGSSATLPS